LLSADKGGGYADAHTFWCKKTPDFLKFMVCPHGQGGGGVEPVQTRGRG